MKPHLILPRLIGVAAVMAASLPAPDARAAAACCSKPPEKTAAAPGSIVTLTDEQAETIGLTTALAAQRQITRTSPALGRLAAVPEKQAVLSSRIAGRVVALHAGLGDEVHEGDVLVEVESRQPGNPPPRIELRAPASGIVGTLETRLGEPVEPDEHLMDINDYSTLYAVARVFESQVAALEAGSKARIRIPAAGGVPIDGELARFGSEANSDSRTVDAYFRVDNPTGRLRPGMQARFEIITQQAESAFSVPTEAVFREGGVNFVYAGSPGAGHTYERVPVRLGIGNDSFVQVVEGLLPGDRVVIAGHDLLPYIGASSALSEAMEAAHGHSHGPGEEGHGDAAHDHGAAAAPSAESPFKAWLTVTLAVFSGCLAVVVALMALKMKRGGRTPEPAGATRDFETAMAHPSGGGKA